MWPLPILAAVWRRSSCCCCPPGGGIRIRGWVVQELYRCSRGFDTASELQRTGWPRFRYRARASACYSSAVSTPRRGYKTASLAAPR